MSRVREAAFTGAAALLALVVLAPLLWMVSVSLMAPGEANGVPPPLLPARPTLRAYVALFTEYRLGRPLLNSLGLATVVASVSLALTTPAGYAFAKLRFHGRERLVRLLFALLVVPGQVAYLPLFLMLKAAHLVDSYLGVIVPFLPGVFAVLFVRQAALAIPDDMLDAARMDGAGEVRVFLEVALPLLRPMLVTLGLFTFLASWNEFLWTLIVLADQRLYTLPVALAALSREHAQDVELMMAGAVVTTAPVLVIFLLLQRHYVRGVLDGGVKG